MNTSTIFAALQRAGVSVLMVLLSVACQFAEAATLTDQDCMECHGKRDLATSRGKSLFIDPLPFSKSAHGKAGIGCVSCHVGITLVSGQARIPHQQGLEPLCHSCHERATREYAKSLHAQVSKNLCYSCHNPHYGVSYRQLSGNERKAICLKCHDAQRSHRWLPQRELHFNYLECTSCHSLNAQIGMLILLVDKNERNTDATLRYSQLQPVVEQGKNLIDTVDLDRNGVISDEELHGFVKRLQDKGIPSAGFEVKILVLNPSHDFSSRGEQARDCTLCHSINARFYSKIVLAVPEPDGGLTTIPVDKSILARRDQGPFIEDFYLLGESKIRREDLDDVLQVLRRIGFKWLDVVGAMLIFSTLAAVAFHGLLMLLTRKLRERPPKIEDESLSFPVRAWHWVHGLCMVLLVLTGLQLRLPDLAPIFANFLNAVNLHNLSGTVLILDYVFWITYHLWKRQFTMRFLIWPRGFFKDTSDMLHYYGYLIFTGGGIPESFRRYAPYDPIERGFFLTLMLVIVPVQIVSGVLLLYMTSLMPVIRLLGGLRMVDAVHLLAGYLFISSMIAHMYFHTLKKYRLAPRQTQFS